MAQPPNTNGRIAPIHPPDNGEAFYELVRPCERRVFAAAFAILGNEADAEEVAQEAILKAYRAHATFRGDSKFSTWLIQITINESRMRIRKQRRYMFESLDRVQQQKDGGSMIQDFPDWREIPSEALGKKELRTLLIKALVDLPLKYRLVMLLRDIETLSIDETARILRISQASVKTRLLRARLKMRTALFKSSYFSRPKQDAVKARMLGTLPVD